MKIVYPITKADGKEFKDNAEIESELSKESIGQFGYNPSNRSWHGGIHISDKSAPWTIDKLPIRAIADGRVVACRIGSVYQVSSFIGTELIFSKDLKFSNDFCLVQHTYTPTDSTESYIFYILYMHLRPQLNIKPGAEVTIPAKRFKLQYSDCYVRDKMNRNGQKKQKINLGSILELDETVSPQKIKGSTYCLFKISDNKGTKPDADYKNDSVFFVEDGQKVWLALEKCANSETLVVDEITDYKLVGDITVTATAGAKSGVILKRGSVLKPDDSNDKTSIAVTNSSGVTSTTDYKAYIVVDNQANTNSIVTQGNTVWLDNWEGLTKIEKAIEPDWFYESYKAMITDKKVECYSDPSVSSLGESLGIIPAGTKVSYKKTSSTYGRYGTENVIMARCTFTDGAVTTLDAHRHNTANSVSIGWVKINKKNFVYTSKTPCTFDTVNSFGSNSAFLVDVTDPIGYLGRYDVLDIDPLRSDIFKVKKRRMVHIEQLAKDKPTDAFLKEIFGEKKFDNIQFVTDENSDGLLDDTNVPPDFFNQLADKVESGVTSSQAVLKAIQPWFANKYTVVKHPSEWYRKSSELNIWDKLKDRYQSQLMVDVLDHEKTRVDSLVWMQDETKIGFGKCVWNWWPIACHHSKLITAELLAVIAPKAAKNLNLINALNKYCIMYEINTDLRVAHFLAQCAHESTGFTAAKEWTHVRKKAAMKYTKFRKASKEKQNEIFPEGQLYGKQPDLYNLVYGGRNGNNQPGDGYKFRGRGFIQLTGRKNYKLYQEKHNKNFPNDKKDFLKDPDLISNILNYKVESACVFWRYIGGKVTNINQFADLGTDNETLLKVSAVVNGWHPKNASIPNKADGFTDRKNKFLALAKFLELM